MKKFNKYIVNEFKSGFGRFVAIMAIVALGVGFLIGVLQATPDMKSTMSNYYLDNHAYDADVKATFGMTKEDVDAIAALDGAAVQLQDTELLTDSLQSPCLLAQGGARIEAAGIRANASESGLLELEDASLTLDNCTLSGAGARLSGTASLTATGGSLTCGTADALFTLTDGEASVSLTGVALTRSGGGALLSVLSGRLSLLCDYQALEGELSVADGATLSVTLQNNSTFTGSVSADERMRLSLSLDATSRWFVTGDSYIEALSDADATLQNIESNGFTIYYNSENEANAWLGSKPYALPGGGYLSPLI